MTDLAGSVSASLTVTIIPDRTPPRLRLRAGSPQRILRQRGILLRASCGEPCVLRASGSIVGAGPLASARARTSGQLRLGVPAATRSRLAALLEQGKSVRALVILRAIDGAGNVTTARRTILVRG